MKYKESLPFYHTAAWKRVRALALARDGGMCQDCMDRFRAGYGFKPRRAEMVHHIIPISERPDLALELSNLRSLCNICHAQEHPEKGGGGPAARAERTARTAGKTPRMRVIKV